MSGLELRKLRRANRWSQKTFAALVGVRQGRLSTIERQQTVPTMVAALARALSLAKNADLKALTSPRLVPWRESSKFSQKPPFERLPENGIACRCGRPDCQLSPERDGDWLNGHLWMFHGSSCGRHVFLNSSGMMVTPARPRHWRDSKLFKKKPPFDAPRPCPMCGKAGCAQKPVRHTLRDGEDLWVGQGADCNRSYCLNAQGKCVGPAPSRSVVRRPVELRKPCSQCGRLRSVQKKFRARLGCEVMELYCRRAKGDAPGRKHDPPELFREENGTFRPLTAQELDLLHDRNRYSFPVPHCEEDNCAGRGQRMERSGVRLGDIVAFVCRRSKPSHYAFRHTGTGEVVRKLAAGRYQSQTGTLYESKAALHKNRNGRPSRERPRKRIEESDDYRLAQAVHLLLPSCRNALTMRRSAQAQWPTDRKKWESVLRQAGFTAQADIDVFISSRTPSGAAAKMVSDKESVSLHRVQNAYSAMKKYLT